MRTNCYAKLMTADRALLLGTAQRKKVRESFEEDNQKFVIGFNHLAAKAIEENDEALILPLPWPEGARYFLSSQGFLVRGNIVEWKRCNMPLEKTVQKSRAELVKDKCAMSDGSRMRVEAIKEGAKVVQGSMYTFTDKSSFFMHDF